MFPAVLHLLEADVRAVEGLGEEVLPGVESRGAGVADASDLDVSRVLGWFDAIGVGAPRRGEAGCGSFVVEGFVGTDLVG